MANFDYLIGSEFFARISITGGGVPSPFSNHVENVYLLCRSKQVPWVDTCPVVTRMAYHLAIRYGTHFKLKGNSVCSQ